tara:strand:+ start:603 stop:2336 length:1734 start_codon:yes stop_codon:yes gene_type:complete
MKPNSKNSLNFLKKTPIKKINIYIILLSCINFLQAVFTPIIADEAYYWMYSKNLAFGYFDHPPMVAYIIKISSFLFPDSILGVRFVTIILLALTVKIVWKLIPKEKKAYKHSELIFMALILSMPIFNLYGFITTPDGPLLLSAALFLVSLNKISKKESFLNILFFGTSIALLIYSKYHGGIIIVLAAILKYELLKKWSTYLSGLIALLLIIPHIYWQFQNDFITFNFHLFQRTSGAFNFNNVIHYLLSTLFILNPALIILLFFNLKKQRVQRMKDAFFVKIFIGFLTFFLIYSFRSRIEAHWVAISAIPMVILIYNQVITSEYMKRKIKLIGIVSIVLIFSARILIMLNLPLNTMFHKERKNYFEAIFEKANGKNVVFVNSYQKASKYFYYTGEQSYSDNNVFYRKNQYDILNSEDYFNDTSVLFIGASPSKIFDRLNVGENEIVLHHTIEKYPIFNKLQASIKNPNFFKLNKNGSLNLTINNPYEYTIDLKQKELPYTLNIHLQKERTQHFIPLKTSAAKRIKPGINKNVSANWQLSDKILNGKYKLQIVMQAGYLPSKVISKKYDVMIKKEITLY